MQAAAARLTSTLEFDAPRALAEVDADYATTTELADTLQRVADVPFRVGHHFASELVNYGRADTACARRNFPDDEVEARLCVATMKEMMGQDNRGVSASARRALHESAHRREHGALEASGLGGPQPSEVERCASRRRKRAWPRTAAWLEGRRKALADAASALDVAFLEGAEEVSARMDRRHLLKATACKRCRFSAGPARSLRKEPRVHDGHAFRLHGGAARSRALPRGSRRAGQAPTWIDTLAAIHLGPKLGPGRSRATLHHGPWRAKGDITILGTALTASPNDAALANGVMGHADETDDSHNASRSHPGCSIVPAALALAEVRGIAGVEFLRAVALG